MKFDITVFPKDLKSIAATGKTMEDYGFDGFWTAEVAHDPFLPLTLIASVTNRIQLGTQIAVAFARSPMILANTAWDLQAQSDGRFILGLGTQVKPHIEKRFSVQWESPVSRLREYIESLHAIWNTWQNGVPFRYEGKHYRFKLMTPFFNPGPIQHPNIPIYIAGVNAQLCRLAGEKCEGLHAHGFHTVKYLRDLVLTNVEQGLSKSGRKRTQFELVVPIFTVTGRNDETMEQQAKEVKSRIAFYASTPSYRVVLQMHGWQDIGDQLSQMARANQGQDMWRIIPDEMLHEIAVVAPLDELSAKIQERYASIADRICFGWDVDDTSSDLIELISKTRNG